jgi:hypothetical protein
MNEVINAAYKCGQFYTAVSLRKFCVKLQRDKVKPELWPGLITDFIDKFELAPENWEDYKPVLSEQELGMPKQVCDVCGSDDITYAPHMGKNCNRCHPL